ncbi:MAG: YcxB family protein [Lyngbya sp. HA4199-MV5]|jgi:hypothetical protein|nr:YcxB family protein [Lyngbya sp. HA4199-MV5]
MEVIYHIKEKDVFAGRRLMRKVSPATKRINRTAMFIVALAPFTHFLLRQQFSLSRVIQMLVEILLITFAYKIFSIVFNPVFDKQAIALLKQQNGGVLGEHKIVITDEALTETTSVNESCQRWTGIEGIYENEEYILVMLGSQHGHIIPKRAFINSDSAKQFYCQAQSYYKKSQIFQQKNSAM